MGKSKIQWTDETWNPVRGCVPISPGCKHCYAKTFSERFRGVKGHPYEQGFDPRLVPEKLDEPLRWAKPRMVFVNSMSDLFADFVPNDYIAAVFGVMAAAPQHTFQILTKRAHRLPEWFRTVFPGDVEPRMVMHEALKRQMGYDHPRRPAVNATVWPLPNVWLGVSVENQEYADERIPHLLRTPAAVRFLSCEPLLGPVDLSRHLRCPRDHNGDGDCDRHPRGCPRIHWVIVGGESGGGARPMAIEWARDLVNQCTDARVPVFVKQMGTRPLYGIAINGGPAPWRLRSDSKGGDPKDWPGGAAAWPREFPHG